MAVARQVQVAAAEDGLVAVQRDIIVDPKSGIAAEVEKVVVAVDVGGGKVAVMQQARIKCEFTSLHDPYTVINTCTATCIHAASNGNNPSHHGPPQGSTPSVDNSPPQGPTSVLL